MAPSGCQQLAGRAAERGEAGSRHALLTSRRLLAVDLAHATLVQLNSSNMSSPVLGAAFTAAISLLLKCSMETSEKQVDKKSASITLTCSNSVLRESSSNVPFVHSFGQPFEHWTPLLLLFLQVYRKTQILWCSSDTIGKIKEVQWLLVSARLWCLYSQNQSGTVSLKDRWTMK